MEPWVPGLLAGTTALLVAIVGGIAQFRSAAKTAQMNAQTAATPGAPTVQEIWKRQDGMETAFRASLVLLAEAVEQHNDPGSIQFNQTAVKQLRESGYMPPELENVLKPSA